MSKRAESTGREAGVGSNLARRTPCTLSPCVLRERPNTQGRKKRRVCQEKRASAQTRQRSPLTTLHMRLWKIASRSLRRLGRDVRSRGQKSKNTHLSSPRSSVAAPISFGGISRSMVILILADATQRPSAAACAGACAIPMIPSWRDFLLLSMFPSTKANLRPLVRAAPRRLSARANVAGTVSLLHRHLLLPVLGSPSGGGSDNSP